MRYSEAVVQYGGKSQAARALGISRNALAWGLAKEEREGVPGKSIDNVLTFPKIPDRKEPIGKLLERRREHFNRLHAYNEASTWQVIAVDSREPIAVAFMGDPHIDDDGCNWPALEEDIGILASAPGMYAVNIGDTTNNWVGRLARLFGNQETSQSSARQLAKWFLTDAGIKWLAVLLGNHDEWNEGGEIIKLMCAAAHVEIPVHEWAAKLELSFPNGATTRISAAHDFKGRSIYNAAHGLKREAIWNQDGADILAAGHIHYGEIGQCELPGGHSPWMLRVRGYKHFDPHALVNGYHEGNRFRSVVAIIDPNEPPETRITVFGSIRQAAAVLAAMRSKPVAAMRSKPVSAKCDPKKSAAKSRKVVAHDTSKKRVAKSGKNRRAGNRSMRSRGRR